MTLQKIILIALLFFHTNVGAWGGKGHDTICQVASQLVQEEGLKSFLYWRPNVMGHLCNMPDIYWKALGPEINKVGSPTHYIDLEVIGLNAADVPLNYSELIKTYTGKPSHIREGNIISVPTELGSLWWRADQFYRLALKNTIKDLPAATKAEEQNDNLEYNKQIFNYMVLTGVMGHYVGDASMPLHSSADYDGYKTGHGGFHSYYEEVAVSLLDPSLNKKIYDQANRLIRLAKQKNFVATNKRDNISFLKKESVLEKMKALSVASLADLNDILKLDPITEKSILKVDQGMQIKTPAKRDFSVKSAQKLEPYIVRHMARSAALLAQLWDQLYIDSGRPNLGSYRSYKYPYTVDFIAPDYLDNKL